MRIYLAAMMLAGLASLCAGIIINTGTLVVNGLLFSLGVVLIGGSLLFFLDRRLEREEIGEEKKNSDAAQSDAQP
jgi:hypothetical protein